ncbi:hypothetical protein CI610_02316 [invertebrate metagenome]|uniref:Uncharacterized protein n=1 Tax=invertebrate metagenome TaxID=1711999 RepID=A0A2H9T694_9ZZZZ
MKHTILAGLLFYTTCAFSAGFFIPPSPFFPDTTTKTAEEETVIEDNPSADYAPYLVTDIMNTAKDNQPVTLSGKIIQRIKTGVYLFRDNSGDIQVYFDADELPKQGMHLNIPAAITGEVDRQPKQPVRVDADNIVFIF